MATFASDTFTGTAGTALTAHTPDVGGSWTNPGGISSVLSNANRVRGGTGSTESDHINQGTPAGADYDVQVDLIPLTVTASYAGVAGRSDATMGTNASTGRVYLAFHDGTAATPCWTLQKGVNNTYTNIATSNATLVANTTYTILLQMRGSAQTVFVNGVSTVTGGDSAVTAAGKAGILIRDAANSNTADYQLDNFSATDAVAAVAHIPPPAWQQNPVYRM
jgi:hypothetical protein